MYEGSIFTEKGMARIFEGELVEVRGGRARVRGFHLEDAGVMQSRSIEIVELTRTASDSRGVYAAQITMQGARRRPAYGGFFPRGWSRERVLEAVTEAYETRRPCGWVDAGNFFEGRTRAGMRILMELDEGGLVLDAFPVRAKNPNNRKRDARLRVAHGITKHHPLVCGRCHSLRVSVCPRGHDARLYPGILLQQLGALVRWLISRTKQ
jgi:hypothetical protein